MAIYRAHLFCFTHTNHKNNDLLHFFHIVKVQLKTQIYGKKCQTTTKNHSVFHLFHLNNFSKIQKKVTLIGMPQKIHLLWALSLCNHHKSMHLTNETNGLFNEQQLIVSFCQPFIIFNCKLCFNQSQLWRRQRHANILLYICCSCIDERDATSLFYIFNQIYWPNSRIANLAILMESILMAPKTWNMNLKQLISYKFIHLWHSLRRADDCHSFPSRIRLFASKLCRSSRESVIKNN